MSEMIKTYLLTVLISFAVSLISCCVLIPMLKRLKAGQNILVYVKEHEKKGGTPTMGGIAFIFACVLTVSFVMRGVDKTALVCMAIGLAYMAVGLLDDLLKWKHKENLGLRAWQKFLFQTVVAVFAGVYCFRAGLTELKMPFISKTIDVDWWIIPIAVFVFLASVNAVNLTDGLDGLAASTSVPFFAAMGILIALQGGENALSLISFALVGGLIAYLLFNVHPASVFMGDTGSLSLGGFVACVSIFSGNVLQLAIIGGCFVFSVISVIIQVIYYKATKGKRIFLMAPVHHHFQKKGYSECRISYAYFVVTAFWGSICILTTL